MVCSGRQYYFKFFKGRLQQILIGPFLNSLNHLKFQEDYEIKCCYFNKLIYQHAENARRWNQRLGYFLKLSKIRSRNSRSEVFRKKDFLENLTKFTGKHLCQSLFLNEIAY